MRKSLRKQKKELKTVTEEMTYSFVGDENYDVIDWDFEKKGELELEAWLNVQKLLKSFKPDSFVSKTWKNQTEKTAQSIQHLVSILNGKFQDLSIYGLGFPKLPKRVYHGDIPLDKKEIDAIGVPIFLFKNEEKWFGLILAQGEKVDGSFLDLTENTPDFDFLNDIKTVFENLDYRMKESSWDMSNHWLLESGEDRGEVFSNMLTNARFLKKQTLDNFLNLENVMFEWDDEYPIPQEKTLSDYLNENLNDLKVWTIRYKISREDWSVHYIWGKTEEVDWLGLQTVSYTF